jgi:hypothetical protein
MQRKPMLALVVVFPALIGAAGMAPPAAASPSMAAAVKPIRQPSGMSTDMRFPAPARTARADRRYTFQTLDNPADPTYNVLTGINNAGVISGYYGSGGAGHPNQGYTLSPPYAASNYTSESFPGSASTQVGAINNKGDIAGSWQDAGGTQRVFIKWKTKFKSFNILSGTSQSLSGLNDKGIAAGTARGKGKLCPGAGRRLGGSIGFTLDRTTGQATAIVHECNNGDSGGSDSVTGINDRGDVVGQVSAWRIGASSQYGFVVAGNQSYEFNYPAICESTCPRTARTRAVSAKTAKSWGRTTTYLDPMPSSLRIC